MRYTGPKARRCRRQGMNLYGAAKYEAILQRKPYPPGKSPKARGARQSEYAQQLLMKQRTRDMYGLTEKQLHLLFAEAAVAVGQTGETFLQFLERRLDNVLYRAGFARTRPQARQMAAHGLFVVNGTRVTLPSFRVSPGHTIIVRPQSAQSPLLTAVPIIQQKYTPPPWLAVDTQKMTVTVTGVPTAADAEPAIDVRRVVEFYSRM